MSPARRSSKSKSDRVRSGYQKVVKGLTFEQKVTEKYGRKGYKPIRTRWRTKTYGEIDILLEREKGTIFKRKERILVECKNKDVVTVKEVIKFVKKVELYAKNNRDVEVYGLLVYTGKLEPEAKSYIKKLPEDMRNLIKVEKMRP